MIKKDQSQKKIMTYDLKTTDADTNLDQGIEKFYGERVQGLRLDKISSELENKSADKSDNDKTCSSIFSCNLFGKSSSDSANSSNLKMNKDIKCN